MHELPVVEDIIRSLDKESERKGIKKIKEIHITIGELSSYVGDCVRMYFDLLSSGHTCEGADLFFEYKRARFKCTACGHEYDHDRDFICPECGGDGKLVKGSGREFLISSIVY